MYKFYGALFASVTSCIVYSLVRFSSNKDGDEYNDEEYTKKQLILFLTIFVITYCTMTLIYDGGITKSSTSFGGNSYNDMSNMNSESKIMNDLLENVELGEPPF